MSKIPKGFRPKAQGCDAGATLVRKVKMVFNAKGVAPTFPYIVRQKEHHQKRSFQDEPRAFLRKHEIEWDEKYPWD